MERWFIASSRFLHEKKEDYKHLKEGNHITSFRFLWRILFAQKVTLFFFGTILSHELNQVNNKFMLYVQLSF